MVELSSLGSVAVCSHSPLGSHPLSVMLGVLGRQQGFLEAASVDADALSDGVELAFCCTFQGPRSAPWQRSNSRRGRRWRGDGSTCRGPRAWAPQHGAAELSAGALNPRGHRPLLMCRDTRCGEHSGYISDAGTQIPFYMCNTVFYFDFTALFLPMLSF